MQHQFAGFRATKPVARVADPKKQLYEVYFIVYSGKQKTPFRYKKDINKPKTRGKRKALAEDWAYVLWEALTSGWNPLQGRYPAFDSELRKQRTMGFNEAIDYCLAEKKKTVKVGTYYGYKHTAKVIKAAAINSGYSQRKITEVQRKDIRMILDQAREDENWSSKTRNTNLGLFKALLEPLIDKDIIQVKPTTGIRNEKQPERVKYKRISEDDRERIVSHLSNVAPDYLDFIYFIYDTGIRPKELLSIKVFDIGLVKREITVRAEVSKTNRERFIPITDDMLSILLKRDITKLDRNLYLFSKDKFSPGPEAYWPTAGARWWRKYVHRALKIDAKLYGLKHSGADAKLLAGIDTRTLKSLYGHSSEQMTERYLEELKEIHKQKIIEKSPSFSAKVVPLKKVQ